MKFMVSWTIDPAQYKEAAQRFLKAGAPPPAGVKMLGRWHMATQGWLIAETDNPAAIFEWTAVWQDLIRFTTVTPVVEDDTIGPVLGKVFGK